MSNSIDIGIMRSRPTKARGELRLRAEGTAKYMRGRFMRAHKCGIIKMRDTKESKDYDVQKVDDKGVTITRYLGDQNQEVVCVPEEIAGRQVLGVAARAFDGCGILSLKFPKTLRRLEFDALSDCHAVEEIVLPGNMDEICGSLQDGCPNLKTVVIEGAEVSAASLAAISRLSGIQILWHYEKAGIAAWLVLGLRAITG